MNTKTIRFARTTRTIAIILLVLPLLWAQPSNAEALADALSTIKSHPRLFLAADEMDTLHAKLDNDPRLQKVAEFVVASAAALREQAPLERKKIGKRLLGVSRECLRRVSYLALAYRLTGDSEHLQRAEAEMLSVAAFTDWNPSHFLDVAEMTAALAIGYDWLYDDLSHESRATIREAIIEKGLKASLKGGWWVSGTNNWNQVCHGGLTMGALAVAEDTPELAQQIIARGLENLPRATHEYEPDGVYPEGPSYWAYGTTYNVLLIDALSSALGDDFGTADAAGLMKSPHFYLHTTGPTGLYYNFSDCGKRGGVAPAMYWFAERSGAPSLLWREMIALQAFVDNPPPLDKYSNRMLVFMLLWCPELTDAVAPTALSWKGDGPTPIAMSRTGWTSDATYAAIKGGSPHTNHAHMDIGSFVVDMDGVRWSLDLGSQSYNSLESKGIDLWNRRQDSERWTVFRLNNFSHSTLVVDGKMQQVAGHAPITHHSATEDDAVTVIDMLPVYEGQLAKSMRGLMLRDGQVLIQDELQSLDRETTVRWGMTTAAKNITIDGNRAALEQDGKKVILQVTEPADANLELIDIAKPPTDYDAENPGVRMLVFNVTLPPTEEARLRVVLHPESDADAIEAMRPLADW